MKDYEKLYKDFVSSPKSLLIAPAGYGKTHTIAECLKYTVGHQLILTHTHAGVASIKEKVKKQTLPVSLLLKQFPVSLKNMWKLFIVKQINLNKTQKNTSHLLF
jgi:hypothetical protein